MNDGMDTLYKPPEQTTLFNTTVQQDQQGQQQGLFLHPQELQSDQQETAPEMETLNITQLLGADGVYVPVSQPPKEEEELKGEKKKEQKKVQAPVPEEKRELTYEEQLKLDEEEADREEYAREQNKSVEQIKAEEQLSIQQSKFAEEQAKLEQEQAEEASIEKRNKAGKVQFKQGINSRPSSCESRSRRKKIAKAKDKLDTGNGVTHLTFAISEKIDEYKKGQITRESTATILAEQLAERRRTQEIKSKKVPVEGLVEREQAVIKLSGWMPAKFLGNIVSNSEAKRAGVLKTLIDKAISYKITPEMISSKELASQYADLRDLTENVPYISKLLGEDKAAARLLDPQKLALFQNVKERIPQLKVGLEHGLNLHGMDTMGISCYYNSTPEQIKADKKNARIKWVDAQNELSKKATAYDLQVDIYGMETERNWEQHVHTAAQSEMPLHRLSADTAGFALAKNKKSFADERGSTHQSVTNMEAFKKITDKEKQRAALALAPANATKQELEQHLEKFQGEDTVGLMKEMTKDLLSTEFPYEGLVTNKNISDPQQLGQLLLLRDKLDSYSKMTSVFKKQLKDQLPDKCVKLMGEAHNVSTYIDNYIQFLESMYSTQPGTTIEKTNQLADGVEVFAAKYKSFLRHYENERSRKIT